MRRSYIIVKGIKNLYGRTSISLKKYDLALQAFENLVVLNPNNSDFTSGLAEVKKLSTEENSQKKSMYKKMFFTAN